MLDLVGIDHAYTHAIQSAHGMSLRDDLAKAREILQTRLGSAARHMAFPMYRGTDESMQIGRQLGYESFWSGTLPGRPVNRSGDIDQPVVRLSAEFIRRLPGQGRIGLGELLRQRIRG
jgi:hypothetical protein